MNWFCLSSFDVPETVKLLRRADYVVYCPHEQITRRAGRKTVDVSRPVWPGYLFIRCDATQIGAALIVGRAHGYIPYTDADGHKAPLRMADNALVPVILAEMFKGLDFTTKTAAAYRPNKGDRVRVSGSKWRGYFGRVMAVSKRKAKLEVEGTGGRLEIEIRELEAA